MVNSETGPSEVNRGLKVFSTQPSKVVTLIIDSPLCLKIIKDETVKGS